MVLQAMELKSSWIRTRAGTMHYRTGARSTSPDTPVVILVHGMVVSSEYMTPTARRLAPLCRVYAIDLPGYGKSEKPKHILWLPELADALSAWMDAVGIPKAHFAANSFGCQIMAELALRYPERVNRMVLQGPTADPGVRSYRKLIFRFMINAVYEASTNPFLGFIMLKDFLRAGTWRSLQTLRMLTLDNIEEKLPRIPMPTLVVRGSKDPLVSQAWVERVSRLLPRGELRTIPGVAHTLNYVAPLELVRVMRPFLQLD